MVNKSHIWILLFFFIFRASMACAIVVGSNSVVSIQKNVVFPSADTDNEMRGFAAFSNGFSLENSSANCTFTSFYPVFGDVVLNGGTLILGHETFFQDVEIKKNGTVVGNGNILHIQNNQPINFVSQQSSAFSTSYITKVVRNQPVNSIDWSHDNTYLVVATDHDSSKELTVYSFNGSTLTEEASTTLPKSALSARWHPSAYYIVVSILDDSYDVFTYEFNSVAKTLTQTDAEYLTGSGYAVAWRPDGAYYVSSSSNTGKELIVVSFSGGSTSIVQNFNMGGSRVIQKNALEWDSTGTYLVVGTDANSSEHELLVYTFNGSALSLKTSIEVGAKVSGVSWSQANNYIAVGLSGGSENLRVYEYNTGSNTLSHKTSANVGENKKVLSVDWNSDGTKLAVGLEEQGSQSEFRVYSFDSQAVTLSLLDEEELFGNVQDVRWTPNNSYIAVGDENKEVNIYSASGSSTEFVFRDTHLEFTNKVALKSTVRFKGSCSLQMNGYGVTFDSNAGLIVDENSNLLIENCKLINVSGTQIKCLDSVATLSLAQTDLVLDGDFTFTKGILDITGEVDFFGDAGFSIESDQPCTIWANARMYFDSGMTFSYKPASSKSLLKFFDGSSVLYLHETTLYANSIGMQLLKGKIFVDGTCPVKSDGSSGSSGIVLGDGSSSANNIELECLAESGLRVESGYVSYKNVS